MSPLVQRPRNGLPPQPAAADQHWGMVLFESLSTGVLAIGIGLACVMAVVAVYALLVWPLTFWDLANLGLERYGWLASTAFWSIFAGGSLAGYWCFSGAAFKKSARRATSSPIRNSRTRR
jgi:hypothetical protein